MLLRSRSLAGAAAAVLVSGLVVAVGQDVPLSEPLRLAPAAPAAASTASATATAGTASAPTSPPAAASDATESRRVTSTTVPVPAVAPAAAPAVRPTATATARATAAVTPTPTATVRAAETLAARRARLLASLHLDWESLGYRVVFTGTRAGYLGLTSLSTRTVTVYVRATSTDRQLLVTLAHELGHAWDLTHGTVPSRAAYLAARGATGTPWWPCGECSDYASGAGDFAEVFAVWLVGSTDYRSTVAPRPTRARAATLLGV